jgi:hypothetical protein
MYVTTFSPPGVLTYLCPSDVFIGLNLIRILSIIACLLVFSSSIVTMVHDVEAVNTFLVAERSNSTIAANMLDCDYIVYVPIILSLHMREIQLSLFSFLSLQRQYCPKSTGWRVLGRAKPPSHHLPDHRAFPL